MSLARKRHIPLGPFQLRKCIGKGGMGEVWRGVHVRQRLKVAVKFMTSQVARDPRYVEAFHREVRAVAGLDHPGVVMVFDHGQVSQEAEQISGGRLVAGSPYLVMEWASGGHLGGLIGTLDWSQIKAILLSLLDALAHAHARGVIHRDLKPPNLLISLDRDIRPGLKLTDFGIAHAMDDDAENNPTKASGTPAYMAPEQIMGLWRDNGPWTDLYALGCVAHELVCGRPPFTGDIHELIHAQLHEAPPSFEPTAPVPAGLGAWLEHLLEKDPAKRFGHAADAAWALLCLDEAGSSASLPPGIPPMPSTWHTRQKARPAPSLTGAGLGLFGLRAVPLVGRDAERDAMWHALSEVRSEGCARLVLLKGTAGVGKSRLVEWVCHRASEVGAATVLKALHSPTDPPRAALSRMMARHLCCIGLDRAGVRQRVEAFLATHGIRDKGEAEALTEFIAPSGGDQPDRAVTFSSQRERHALLTRFIGTLSETRPVVVWLDDVQWGRDALELVHYALQHQGAQCPMLFLVTARTDTPEFDEGMLSDALQSEANTSLHIEPLAPEARRELIHGLLGLDSALTEQVEARSEGNPLFAVQLVGDWVQRGILEISVGGFTLRKGEEAQLPDNIHEIWASRLHHLLAGGDPSPLELAAVLGMEVSAAEWREACRVSEIAIDTGFMEALFDDRLLVPTEGGWAFVHGMLRESLLRMARDEGRLDSRHRSAAAALEALYPPHSQGLSERLGCHLFEAGDCERALAPLLSAAETNLRLSAFERARELLSLRDEALTRLGAEPEDPSRIEGWLHEARVALYQSRFDQALTLTQKSIQAAQHHHRPILEARALVIEATHAQKRGGDLAHAESLLNRALTTFENQGARFWMGKALSDLGGVFLFDNRLSEARRVLRQSMALFEALGDEAHYHEASAELGKVAVTDEAWDEAELLLHKALDFFERRGQRLKIADTLNELGELRRYQGDLEGAERAYRRTIELARALGITSLIYEYNLAQVVMARGNYDEARMMLGILLGQMSEEPVQGSSIHLSLLPCAAHAEDWLAWDAHFEGAQIYIDSGVVERDDAQMVHLAADMAASADQHQRATAAYMLARQWWVVLASPDKIAEIDAALAASPTPVGAP